MDTSMTLETLSRHAERSWNVWGPCSGGVIIVYLHEGRVYTYYGGDAGPPEGDAIREQSIDEYARTGDADVVAWLRAEGRVG
jgi:hypothetical protein